MLLLAWEQMYFFCNFLITCLFGAFNPGAVQSVNEPRGAITKYLPSLYIHENGCTLFFAKFWLLAYFCLIGAFNRGMTWRCLYWVLVPYMLLLAWKWMHFILCNFLITCLFGAFNLGVTHQWAPGRHYKIFTQPMLLSLLSPICVQNLV